MKLILLLSLSILLFADLKEKMVDLYQNQKYEEVCNLGFDYFKNNKQDEEFLSLYAFSCLESDYIDRIALPTALLKFTKDSRANAAYFSVILMQKKLLYHALVDGYDLSKMDLPTTEHVLSKVFDLYSKLGKHDPRAFYIFEDAKDPKLTYKLYLVREEPLSKMVIEEYYDTMALKRHVYW
ncbi:MAG: hypothetical protein IE916_00770 [Epsilonproteobacteria bacterium]|nr:hypothetical protein [Campylobacterota bacterium]